MSLRYCARVFWRVCLLCLALVSALASPSAASPTLTELREAFDRPERVRVLKRPPFVLLTDVAKLNGDVVLVALHRMWRQTRDDFPALPNPKRPVVLLIFETADEYGGFWSRMRQRFFAGLDLSQMGGGGVTVNGIASAWFHDADGPVLPSYVHEGSHALAYQVLDIPDAGWLIEAIAQRYELDVAWQWLAPLVLDKLRNPSEIVPLDQLLSGRRIAGREYWQALLVWEWLLAKRQYRGRVPGLLEAMRRRGSTDMRPLVQEHFGMSMAELERGWLAWVRANYGP
jgi:hypothetical protein